MSDNFYFSSREIPKLDVTRCLTLAGNTSEAPISHMIWTMSDADNCGYAWVGGSYRTEFNPVFQQHESVSTVTMSEVTSSTSAMTLHTLFPQVTAVNGNYFLGSQILTAGGNQAVTGGGMLLTNFNTREEYRGLSETFDYGDFFILAMSTEQYTSSIAQYAAYAATYPRCRFIGSVTNDGVSDVVSGTMSIVLATNGDPVSTSAVQSGDIVDGGTSADYFRTYDPTFTFNFGTDLARGLSSVPNGLGTWDVSVYTTNMVQVSTVGVDPSELPNWGFSGINSVYVYPTAWDTSTGPVTVSVAVTAVTGLSSEVAYTSTGMFTITPKIYDFTSAEYTYDSVKFTVKYSDACGSTYENLLPVYRRSNGDWVSQEYVESVAYAGNPELSADCLAALRNALTATTSGNMTLSSVNTFDINQYVPKFLSSGLEFDYYGTIAAEVNSSGWTGNAQAIATSAYNLMVGANISANTVASVTGRRFGLSGDLGPSATEGDIVDWSWHIDTPESFVGAPYDDFYFARRTVELRSCIPGKPATDLEGDWIVPPSISWNWYPFAEMSPLVVVKDYELASVDLVVHWEVPTYADGVTLVTKTETSAGRDYLPIGTDNVPMLGRVEWTYPLGVSAYSIDVNGQTVSAFGSTSASAYANDVYQFRFVTPDVNYDVYTVSGVAFNTTETSSKDFDLRLQKYFVPDGVDVSVVSIDNAPETRTVVLSASPSWLKQMAGNPTELHDRHYTRWSVTAIPDDKVRSIELYTDDGDEYIPGTNAGRLITAKIMTETFTGYDAEDISFTVDCELWGDDENTNFSLLGENTAEFVLDTFPAPSEYLFSYDINGYVPVYTGVPNEIENAIWDTGSKINGSVFFSADSVYPPIPVLSAFIVNKTAGTTAVSVSAEYSTSLSATYSIPTTGDVYAFSVVGFTKAANWLSAHSVSGVIDYHYYSGSLLDAEFGVYPTNAYGSGSWTYNTPLTHPFTTFGASAYAEGHVEQFIFESTNTEPNVLMHLWYTSSVEQSGFFAVASGSGASAILPWDKVTSGMTVYHQIISDDIGDRVGMPLYRLAWDTGLGEYIPCAYNNMMHTSAPGVGVAPSLENIRMFSYPPPANLEIRYSNDFILSGFRSIIMSAEYSMVAPVELKSVINNWTVSDPDWYVKLISIGKFPTVANIDVGYEYTKPGVVEFGSIDELVITDELQYSSQVDVDKVFHWGDELNPVSDFVDPDWGLNTHDQILASALSMTAVPDIAFNADSAIVGVGQDVVINNSTANMIYTGFLVNDGYHEDNISMEVGMEAYTIAGGYPGAGNYDWSVTAFVTPEVYFVKDIRGAVNVYQFDEYDADVERVYGITELLLPNYDEKTLMPPNEWVTADTFNQVLGKLNENFEYLRAMSKFYARPPLDYVGFIGSYMAGSRNRFGYLPKDNDFGQTQDNALSGSDAVLTNCTCVMTDERSGLVHIINDGKIYVMDKRPYGGVKYVIDHSQVNEKVDYLKSVGTDSAGHIYALAPNINRVVVFDRYDSDVDYPCRFITEWGGYGGASAKNKFRRPNDVMIDHEDNVWVADTGNKAVKKYTNTGSWLLTIVLPDYLGETPEDGLVSMCVDYDGNIHALAWDRVFKYGADGTFMSVYLLETRGETPKMIRPMSDAGFLYIVFGSFVQKVNVDGGSCGTFGETVVNPRFTGIWHDSYRNLYVSNTNNVLVFCDGVVLKRTANQSYENYMWNMDEIRIQPNEMIQDWVCNISLQRFYDNLDLFRRSLLGKAEYADDNGNTKIVEVDYTPDELETLKFVPKSDVFVGVNELVTRDVLNRGFRQLGDCIRVLSDHL